MVIGFTLTVLLAAMLACTATATLWRTRASLQLVFATKAKGHKTYYTGHREKIDFINADKADAHDDAGGCLTLFRFQSGQAVEPVIRAPSWPGYLQPLQACGSRFASETGKEYKKNCDAEDNVSCGEDDELSVRPRPGVDRQVFNDCLDSFDACGDRLRALALKVALLSRYPGHRGAVSRAFREIYD